MIKQLTFLGEIEGYSEVEVVSRIERQLLKPKKQLLKWIGNKQRFAHEIVSFFPSDYGTYFEPFLGSAAVLGTLEPKRAVGSDVFQPLIEIWQIRSEER